MKKDTMLYYSNGQELFEYNITCKVERSWTKKRGTWSEASTRKLPWVWIPINSLKKRGFDEIRGKQLTKLLLTL